MPQLCAFLLCLCLILPVPLATEGNAAAADSAAPTSGKAVPAKPTSAKPNPGKSVAPKAPSALSGKTSASKGSPAATSTAGGATRARGAAPHGNARSMGASLKSGAWYMDGAPRAGRGAVWEQGISMQSLSRKRVAGGSGIGATGGVNTQKGIDSALEEISAYERQPANGSALGLNKPGVPQLKVTTEESSWRNPVTAPTRVGQEVMTTRRNVVGAYADVVKSDDLHVTVGPELHVPDTETGLIHLAPQQQDSSALGVGMKWQWDF